ncbi:MAG: rhomboid family intramembrane serine protease [Myxococcota bacterium]|nr:rhomboid family intramembrane serine protease [Myxococcota bacterium]
MRQMPSLRKIPDYPVTGGLCVLALVTSILFWANGPSSIDAIDMHPAAFHGEPWRLLASVLPHGDFLHLAFNLYWTWIFGTLVEEVFGSWWTALLLVFLAAGSAAAEYAVFVGGIGLSGIGFGLCGLLWVLGKRDPRFLGAVDKVVVQLFVAWFFLCIVLTVTGALPVANVAHGSGAVIGVCMGLAISARDTGRRRAAILLNVAWLVGISLGATVALPWVNQADGGGRDLGWRAAILLENGEITEGTRLLDQAIEIGGGEFHPGFVKARRTLDRMMEPRMEPLAVPPAPGDDPR